MALPRPPDWLIYSAVLGALLIGSLQGRENANAPPAPPTPDEGEGALLGPVTPFDPLAADRARSRAPQADARAAAQPVQEGEIRRRPRRRRPSNGGKGFAANG